MPNYLRNYVYGGCYFFTLVTYKRICYFQIDSRKNLVLSRIKQIGKLKNSALLAYCVLPNHIHLLMQLPDELCNYSYQIREIKRLVTLDIQKDLGQHPLRVWQDRFWEHSIRDEKDLERHLNYIHFNPVKHGYVENTIDWEWSSYPGMILEGVYPLGDCLGTEELTNIKYIE